MKEGRTKRLYLKEASDARKAAAINVRRGQGYEPWASWWLARAAQYESWAGVATDAELSSDLQIQRAPKSYSAVGLR